jgi:hypothetical protein
MSNSNGNGEVQRIIDLKHRFKDEIAQLEADIKARLEAELESGKKDLKDKYLEQLVDWFFSNGFNAPPEVIPAEPPIPAIPSPTPTVEVTIKPQPEETTEAQPEQASTDVCDTCGSTLDTDAKFCSQCSAPVETETQTNTEAGPVVPAGRLTRPVRGRVQTPTDRERMIRVARQMATAPSADSRRSQNRR